MSVFDHLSTESAVWQAASNCRDGRIAMVANLETLSEAVDLTRIDRKLADTIESQLDRINAEIALQGFSDVTVDGKTFRVSRTVAPQVAAGAA